MMGWITALTIIRLALWGALSTFASAVHADYLLSDGTEVAPLQMFQECDVCPEMIALPMGEFMMGGPPGESKRNFHWDEKGRRPATAEEPYIAHREGPVHSVRIDLSFAMGRNEVTRDEWMACVEDGGCSKYVPEDFVIGDSFERIDLTGNHPVNDVSYLDALAYTDWLNKKLGIDAYRLPTEAEWEYAARAGTQTPFAQGEEVTTDQANFHAKPTEEMIGEKRPDLVWRGYPVRVDELDASNAWGLQHMSGNVGERTMSCWTATHPGWSTSSQHLEMARSVDCHRRVVKGGSYPFAMDFSRAASRGGAGIDWRSKLTGFRILREFK
ncbi:formylglycine-generating enzyme family protein [Ruegeria faecimaris]|uniref:Formylglycine-generating enzyme, required for sulfatase activity, contains SUMF1/FGE domain n=1 Tax=Ruegeria faecimaris TaxID=686389 RepID=A0A521AHU5_9RHOB|nr:formylglycine-generating enzyme family protein [Ruegeria faecimaris]SMO34331.1 Formylglycine-generating enzyme, required for sulfatase activity, contains SUMF1/FGE domain [Ruegeria faecimaris]